VLSAFELLQIPASAPPLIVFFWLYLNALAALASVMAAAAAVAALVLNRRSSRSQRPEDGGDADPVRSALDAAEETNLNRLLSERPPVADPSPGTEDSPGSTGADTTGRAARKKRKRR
jgi:hypothetical protein